MTAFPTRGTAPPRDQRSDPSRTSPAAAPSPPRGAPRARLSLADRRARENDLAGIYQRHPARHNEVVTELMPLARSAARSYKRGEEPLEDLVQVASVGLVNALERWDPERGSAFYSFAKPTMIGELRRHYRDTGWAVHVPRAQQELAQRVTAAERSLSSEGGSDPTVGEVARALDEPEEAVHRGRVAARAMRATSLDRPLNDDEGGGSTLIDRLVACSDPGFERAEDRATLGELARGLPHRDRSMLVMRYGQNQTQRHIGRRMGISQMQVSRELRRIEAALGEVAEPSPSGDEARQDHPMEA